MRVLQITNYYYPNYGGIEQVAHDISQALSEKGVEQRIICANSDAKAGDIISSHKENVVDIVDGVTVQRCRCVAKIASQSISASYPRILKKTIEEFKPDYIILHYPNPYVAYFALQHKNCGAKLILYWHSDIVKQKILGKFFYGLEDDLAQWATNIVATSPNYIDGSRILSKYRDKCIVIPNCVNESRLVVTEIIQNKANELKEASRNKITCFAMGRHVPYKGFEYLIKASKRLDSRFEIFIAGSGPLTDELKKLAGDDKKIHFTGRLSDEDLIARYMSCDIFCFPSITKNEAFGVVLAEAMYFGKPAVTFTIPGSGVNYVNISDVTGLECPNKDVTAYAEALVKLADDPYCREKLGNNAKNRAETLFLYRSFKNNIYELLKL